MKILSRIVLTAVMLFLLFSTNIAYSLEWNAFVKDGSIFSSFDYPGAVQTHAYDINDAGQIVGYYVDVSSVSSTIKCRIEAA